ncbi:hypothetical protein ONE63_011281 [Megalurothrips usitatus]|uniref:Uncharacterized protein n=1 Tax=Megalurothrips usitatus TaxID=439358 RepID=A0AAV7X3P6_9NEOP|nr:hypothetical protein ONE63_011281 [Megalurothrips usitatus]
MSQSLKEQMEEHDGGVSRLIPLSLKYWAKAYASANYKCKDTKTGGGAGYDSICSTVGTVEKTPEYACYDSSVNRIMAIIGWHNVLGIGIPDELDNSVEENKRMLRAIMETLENQFINVESTPVMPNVAATEEMVHINELSGVDFNIDNFLVFSPDSGSC